MRYLDEEAFFAVSEGLLSEDDAENGRALAILIEAVIAAGGLKKSCPSNRIEIIDGFLNFSRPSPGPTTTAA
jgi:hypothetical protein